VTGYLVQPMPKDHLILRAENGEVGMLSYLLSPYKKLSKERALING